MTRECTWSGGGPPLPPPPPGCRRRSQNSPLERNSSMRARRVAAWPSSTTRDLVETEEEPPFLRLARLREPPFAIARPRAENAFCFFNGLLAPFSVPASEHRCPSHLPVSARAHSV